MAAPIQPDQLRAADPIDECGACQACGEPRTLRDVRHQDDGLCRDCRSLGIVSPSAAAAAGPPAIPPARPAPEQAPTEPAAPPEPPAEPAPSAPAAASGDVEQVRAPAAEQPRPPAPAEGQNADRDSDAAVAAVLREAGLDRYAQNNGRRCEPPRAVLKDAREVLAMRWCAALVRAGQPAFLPRMPGVALSAETFERIAANALKRLRAAAADLHPTTTK
jgi:hypothetical protein